MNLPERAQALYRDVIAPLVLGGTLRPGRPIGTRDALAMGGLAQSTPLEHEVQRARLQRARHFFAVDTVNELTAAEWALSAAFHDILQSTHPGLNRLFRAGAALRALDMARATLERVPPPRTAGEALFRHTVFARAFELTRKDTEVQWWMGAEQFRGTEPPTRLTALPRLRRVRISSLPRPVGDLARAGGAVRDEDFHQALFELLRRSPLTDLCSCTRESPAFVWSDEALSFLAASAGLRLALRGLRTGQANRIDAALGRATRKLVAARSWHALSAPLALLRERSLERAWLDATAATKDSAAAERDPRDAETARRLGAASAREWLRHHAGRFAPSAEQAMHRGLRDVPPEEGNPELLRVVALLSRDGAP